jgi:hypothetical protein
MALFEKILFFVKHGPSINKGYGINKPMNEELVIDVVTEVNSI